MLEIKACIFDLDGVICDTAKYHYVAWKRLAYLLGFEFTVEDNERLKGVSRMDSLNILLQIGNKEFDEDKKLELATMKNSWYVEYIKKMEKDEILEGIKDFLLELKERGIKISLGSASRNAGIILDRLQIRDYFDAIVDGNKIQKAKPDPEVFLVGAKELGIDPKDCIVFEDAVAGIEAAKNANMRCIGVGSKETLKNADKVIDGFRDIHVSFLENF